MAQNKQHLTGESTELATRAESKTGIVRRVLRFLRKASLKASLGIWSQSQLKEEVKNALDCWDRACTFTDQAIKRKAAANFKLERFNTWLAALEPQYKVRYATPLHARQRKLEIEVYEANYSFTGLEQQEQRWIKRLIKLKSLNFLFLHPKH